MLEAGEGSAPEFERGDGTGAVEAADDFFALGSGGDELGGYLEGAWGDRRGAEAFGFGNDAGDEAGGGFGVDGGVFGGDEQAVNDFGAGGRREVDEVDSAVAFVGGVVVDDDLGGGVEEVGVGGEDGAERGEVGGADGQDEVVGEGAVGGGDVFGLKGCASFGRDVDAEFVAEDVIGELVDLGIGEVEGDDKWTDGAEGGRDAVEFGEEADGLGGGETLADDDGLFAALFEEGGQGQGGTDGVRCPFLGNDNERSLGPVDVLEELLVGREGHDAVFINVGPYRARAGVSNCGVAGQFMYWACYTFGVWKIATITMLGLGRFWVCLRFLCMKG